jgi:hypothetical protein
MFQVFAPYRVHARFGGRGSPRPDRLPIPWAVRIENVAAARVAVDCLKQREVSRVEVVVGPAGLVYIRWTD